MRDHRRRLRGLLDGGAEHGGLPDVRDGRLGGDEAGGQLLLGVEDGAEIEPSMSVRDLQEHSAQFGITLNVTKALSLPAACHVSTPSVSNCGLSLVAGAAPATSPVSAVSPSPIAGGPTSPSGGMSSLQHRLRRSQALPRPPSQSDHFLQHYWLHRSPFFE
ncbi:bifunctional inhibitor/lipid-transfer protein/seed storage 2S albumin superfamily protein [Actinidia rufa]|uniref:Bifunctional inhibitor/lipid-transfer protein/seed storage 2S albumin superfamily protein n=1 Tax=Actinidia rufa TaxID=165716 RepID=A0A7J0EST2_9ERIC|nr:bifunctional inhibitor/lipid-transfer protein/seed storage 2S albumin superfamily protein [Actinidia rufa]